MSTPGPRAPTSPKLGLSGIGISASGSTAAGEFDGAVNVRDGLGNLAAAIVPSATGTANDIELYQAGTLSVDHSTVSEGHQHQFLQHCDRRHSLGRWCLGC